MIRDVGRRLWLATYKARGSHLHLSLRRSCSSRSSLSALTLHVVVVVVGHTPFRPSVQSSSSVPVCQPSPRSTFAPTHPPTHTVVSDASDVLYTLFSSTVPLFHSSSPAVPPNLHRPSPPHSSSSHPLTFALPPYPPLRSPTASQRRH